MTLGVNGLEDRLRASGDWLGASCVPRWRDSGFLLAGRVAGTSLVLSGVGGRVEPGETFRSAMFREYREETGTDLGPLVTPQPRWLTAEARGQLVPECAAALVVERPPAHPTGGALWIAVFLAVAVRTPQPVEKVELFVVVPAGTGAPDGANPPVNRLSLLVDGDLVPADRALPAAVTEVTAEHTAAAVLGTQGLLTEWWLATAQRSTH